METKITDLEARKKQLIKKKRRNRLKRRFIIFIFLFVCTAVIFTVLKAPFFNVKTIVCVGQETLNEEQIIKIAGAETGVNIFSTSVKAMKRRLSENPNIEQSNVRRIYPNKIKIWVKESKAIAFVESGGLLLLVDKDGQIIKVADQKDSKKADGIARLEGFDPRSTKLGEYIIDSKDPVHQKTFECIGIMDKLKMLDKVTSISAADLSDIKVDYDNRLYIMLGSYDKMEYKLTFINKVISQNLSEYEKAILDYRGEKLYVGPRTAEDPEQAENKEAETAENSEGAETVNPEGAETEKPEDEETADNGE